MSVLLLPSPSVRPNLGSWIPSNHNVQLEGYQLYAVEKWIVDRTRPVDVLVVYTGDLNHKISLTAFKPSPTLSIEESQSQWDQALHRLRRDARPKETSFGTLMVTSLAHFRSDYTIVHIPNGKFTECRDQLYTNINLLRVGASGRTALTLEDPSDTTKDRFISMYCLVPRRTAPEKQSQDANLFILTVLEFVKLLQAALSIFGFYTGELDGLLCDETVEGIRKWVLEVGESFVPGLEPTERIADPMVVSALFSLLLVTRNKLSTLGQSQVVPKDPFLHPELFTSALASYLHGHSRSISHSTTSLPALLPIAQASINITSPTPTSASASGWTSPFSSPTSVPQTQRLTPALLTTITSSFAVRASNKTSSYLSSTTRAKARLGGKKGIKSPGEGSDPEAGIESGDGGGAGSLITGLGSSLALGLSGGAASGATGTLAIGATHTGGAANMLNPIVSLETFVKVIVGDKDNLVNLGSADKEEADSDPERNDEHLGQENADKAKKRDKDSSGTAMISGSVAGSLRALWTGRAGIIVRIRDRVAERQRAREELLASGLDVVDDHLKARKRNDNASTEEESDLLYPGASIGSAGGSSLWGRSGRVRGKLESWTGKIDSKLNRSKRSLDLSPSASPGGAQASSASNAATGASRGTRFSLTSLSTTPVDQNTLYELLNAGRGPSTRAQSPGIGYHRADVDNNDDDDLLSSGQASPVSDDPRSTKPFSILHPHPRQNSLQPPLAPSPKKNQNINASDPAYDKKVAEFVRKRPWGDKFVATRVTSWSDPVSARGEAEIVEAGPSSNGAVPKTPMVTATEDQGRNQPRGKSQERHERETSVGPASHRLRRRSFHSLSQFQEVKVLSVERLRIDVELSGQLLIMWRRDEHLRNVIATLQVLTSRLSATNTHLREEYQSHLRDLARVESRTKILAELDADNSKADKISQAANSLRYESEQFHIDELWQVANAPRQKVFDHRHQALAGSGRRLATGVHGAHGKFNRRQWTLDGKARLVDGNGRTESEAEEESRVDASEQQQTLDEEDEEEIVQNPIIKPMWLLRFLTSWVSKWGARAPDIDVDAKAPVILQDELPEAKVQ
ncbi:hypothetical protein C8J56DRAFT_783202 [Mycena floridula]|nr:hypothetical protein C8J56DRAFT_783202 [Mycena floridula]